MNKNITVDYYSCSLAANDYITSEFGKADVRFSIEKYGNYYQFRNIENNSGSTYGRLCKIVTKNKPKVGGVNSDNEDKLDKDIIASSAFRYVHADKRFLWCRNSSVTTSFGGIIASLIRHLHPQAKNQDIDILPVYVDRKIIIRRIKESGGYIKSGRLYLPGDAAILFRGEDDDLDNPEKQMQITPKSEEIIITYKVEGLNSKYIRCVIDMFETQKIRDASFSMEKGNTIFLSELAEKERISVPVSKDGYILYKDLYQSISALNVT